MADEQTPNDAPAPEPGGTTEIRMSEAEYRELLAARDLADQLRRQQSEAGRSVEERVAAIEARYRHAAGAGAVEAALAPLPFVNDQARADARALLRADIDIREDPATGEAVAFHRPTGRPLGQVSAQDLEQRFAHLVRPASAGGSGATAPGGPWVSGGPRAYANRGEAALGELEARHGVASARPLEPHMPVGIGRFIVHGRRG